MKPRTATRPVFVSLFRYSLRDHEAMANTYPQVLRSLGESADVHHFCSKGLSRHWVADAPGITIHELPLRFRRSVEYDKWIKTAIWYVLSVPIAWWARRHRAALVYVEESMPLLAWWIALVSGRPVAMSAADVFWDVYLPNGILGRRLKGALLRVDVGLWRRLRGLVTHTRAFRDFAVEHGVAADRIYVVPEACEGNVFRPVDRAEARRAAGYGEGDVVLLHHGILAPNKALDRVIRFVAPVLHARPEVRLVFAGDGPLRHRLEAMAREEGLANQVLFTGWLPQVSDLNTLLNAADVSLVMREGRFSDHFQVTANLLHSLACGCTILAARVKGIAELVDDGVNGLLFDPADGQSFAAQLERLLGDAEERRRLGAAALETARGRLDPERISSKWTNALIELMTPLSGRSL